MTITRKALAAALVGSALLAGCAAGPYDGYYGGGYGYDSGAYGYGPTYGGYPGEPSVGLGLSWQDSKREGDWRREHRWDNDRRGEQDRRWDNDRRGEQRQEIERLDRERHLNDDHDQRG